jgi:hypothetical protein
MLTGQIISYCAAAQRLPAERAVLHVEQAFSIWCMPPSPPD